MAQRYQSRWIRLNLNERTDTVAKLFEPITLRDVEIRNRIFIAPMCMYSCEDRDGMPRFFPFVALSIGAVRHPAGLRGDAEQVANAAARAKHRAKVQGGGLWEDTAVAAPAEKAAALTVG